MIFLGNRCAVVLCLLSSMYFLNESVCAADTPPPCISPLHSRIAACMLHKNKEGQDDLIARQAYECLPNTIHTLIEQYANVQTAVLEREEKDRSFAEVSSEGHFAAGWKWWYNQLLQEQLLKEGIKASNYALDQQLILNFFLHCYNRKNRSCVDDSEDNLFLKGTLGREIFVKFSEKEQKLLLKFMKRLPVAHHSCIEKAIICDPHVSDINSVISEGYASSAYHSTYRYEDMIPRPIAINNEGDVALVEPGNITPYILVVQKRDGHRIPLSCSSGKHEFAGGAWCNNGEYFMTVGHVAIPQKPKDNLLVHAVCSVWRWPSAEPITRSEAPCFTEDSRTITEAISTFPFNSDIAASYDPIAAKVTVTIPEKLAVCEYSFKEGELKKASLKNVCGQIIPKYQLILKIKDMDAKTRAQYMGEQNRVDAERFFELIKNICSQYVTKTEKTIMLTTDGLYHVHDSMPMLRSFEKIPGTICPKWPIFWSDNFVLVPYRKGTQSSPKREWVLISIPPIKEEDAEELPDKCCSLQ